MPRMNPVLKSLKDICLKSITQNMDQVWCKDYVETYCRKENSNKFYLYVIGPFDPLRKLMSLLLAQYIELVINSIESHHPGFLHPVSIQATPPNYRSSQGREAPSQALPRAAYNPAIRCS